MHRTWLLGLVGAAGIAAACGTAAPTAPSAASTATTAVVRGIPANVGEACTVDIGETTARPLPALHFMAAMFGVASSQADLNCGSVRSLDAKLEAIATALDQNPPNFHAGCGTSGALLNELEALLGRGALQNITFEAPAPDAPTTLLGLAEELNATWCAAARGEITGPSLP